MSRFDYVKYDERSVDQQVKAKNLMCEVEKFVYDELTTGRARSLIFQKLEEAYMWIGKAIRDDQIARVGAVPLLEERNDS